MKQIRRIKSQLHPALRQISCIQGQQADLMPGCLQVAENPVNGCQIATRRTMAEGTEKSDMHGLSMTAYQAPRKGEKRLAC